MTVIKYNLKVTNSLPSQYFSDSKVIAKIHEEIETGKIYYDAFVSRTWNLFHSSSCSCGEPKDITIRVTTGLSRELYNKSDLEIGTNLGISLASVSAKVSKESGENLTISTEQTIEDKTTFHAPLCGKK
jgi:hypothetical protein